MIIGTLNCSNIINRCVLNTSKNNVRSLSFRRIKKYFTNPLRCKVPTPPYEHICQIGDPVLRMRAAPVDQKEIQTHKFQKMLEHMSNVLRKQDMVGLAAPQIGLSCQVFVIEMTEKSLNEYASDERELKEMEVIPLTHFINPKLEITNSSEVTCFERCGSVRGFEGKVPRAKEVQIKAFNRFGDAFTWSAKGWAARIAQHEFDHLQGKLYVDKMNPSTFECYLWEIVNLTAGEVELKYNES